MKKIVISCHLRQHTQSNILAETINFSETRSIKGQYIRIIYLSLSMLIRPKRKWPTKDGKEALYFTFPIWICSNRLTSRVIKSLPKVLRHQYVVMKSLQTSRWLSTPNQLSTSDVVCPKVLHIKLCPCNQSLAFMHWKNLEMWSEEST